MPTLSVEKQIARLRPASGFAAHMHRWFLLAAALGVVAAVILWHPVPLMVAVFLGVVGFAEQRAGPNIVAAIKAYDAGVPSTGEVLVSLSSWDNNTHYRATVQEQGLADWSFEFVPQGWQPAGREYPAQIWRANGMAQPILVAVEEGILIPRHAPVQNAAA
jgi:hypothetical protein